MARNKRPTQQDIQLQKQHQQTRQQQMEQQMEQLRRLAIEDLDVRFQNYLLNRTPNPPNPRDGPKKK
jgi:hypothetical protein